VALLHADRQRSASAGGAAGAISRCDRCSITWADIGGMSITWCRWGSGSSPCNRVPQRRQALGWDPARRRIALPAAAPARYRSGPAARHACGHCRCGGQAAKNPGHHWRAALRSCGSCGQAVPAGQPVPWPRTVSCWRSCSFSSCKACTWLTSSLTLDGVAGQSASEIPAGALLISSNLCLRSKR